MDVLAAIYETVESWGLHRGGWLFISALALLPAIVGGNMVQFYLTRWMRRELSFKQVLRPLIGNFAVMLAGAAIIAATIYMYTR